MLGSDIQTTSIRSAEINHPSPALQAREGPPLLSTLKGGKYACP